MSTIKEIPSMNYNAPENISALDVYEQLISYYQKKSIGKLVATWYCIINPFFLRK